MSSSVAREIRYALSDAKKLCEALGLLADKRSWQRQAGGVIVRCPWHGEKNPSCSVRKASDGTIAVRCFSCGTTGDALSLIAETHGLTMRGDDFRQVLILAAELAGLHALVAELETGEAPRERRKPVPRPEPEPARDYPPAAEVEALWRGSVAPDADARAWAEQRNIDAQAFGAWDGDGVALARSLPPTGDLPRWASYRGASWRETGHRLIVPAYDYVGNLRSVRAIRVVDGDGPKRLPPGGHRASGLVQACWLGIGLLRGTFAARRVLILEGEPDFLTWSLERTQYAYARFGITSGSWTDEIASRIPATAQVYLHTHRDAAGDRYAKAIRETLPKHDVFRWEEKAA